MGKINEPLRDVNIYYTPSKPVPLPTVIRKKVAIKPAISNPTKLKPRKLKIKQD
jgi:hypothetical protein